jgi:hypothetical protein
MTMNQLVIRGAKIAAIVIIIALGLSTVAKHSRAKGRHEGFIAGCTDAANGVAAQFGVQLDPDALAKVCEKHSAQN